jgi:hypothetical protein
VFVRERIAITGHPTLSRPVCFLFCFHNLPPTNETPLTPRARHALSLVIDEAKAMKLATVAPEHIFLGLLRESQGAAAIILKNMGFQVEAARSRIQARLRSGS